MSGRSPRGVTATSSTSGMNSSFLAKSPTRRQERQTNFKVVIRVRPPLPRELAGDVPFQNVVAVDEREQLITVSENLEAVLDENGNVIANPGQYNTHCFTFDHVYDENASQKRVYETTARQVVDSALLGYNATIFAYGQTGTGKTFTMEGFNREGNVEARGIIPRAIEQIFGHIQRYASPRMRFLVRASYLQIYNEAISDLLKPERSNLTIREDKKRGVYVEGLSEWVVRSPAEIYGLMERGGTVRATGETKMNEASSRSHAVFIIIAEQSETVYVDDHGVEMSPEEFQKFMHGRGVRREQEMSRLEDHVRQSFKVGKLNLVDLAGSERVRISGASGQRLEESKQINRSLSALGNVISALTDTKGRQHIPYRDSKLTRMLEDSLGGNCRTTMMAMISPALEAMLETISTLKFANRAKNIRNEARVNEDLDQKSLLRKYERELKKLRAELEERSKNVVDKRRLLELDEQRRRAEADKMAAIRALEARSLEFMHEKEEKKRLEQRIAMLMGQMIRGERTVGAGDEISTYAGSEFPVPEIQVMMKEQQEKLRQEYEGKLADLERERESIEEEKAQVDRYKQLLLKQRDIMIALTQRLVERDEQIMALQDELDAYDRHHKELEEKLDEKTALLIKFQRISMEVNAVSPYKNEELRRAIESWSVAEQEEMASKNGGGGRKFGPGNGRRTDGQDSETESGGGSSGPRVRFVSDAKGPTEVNTEDDDESTIGSVNLAASLAPGGFRSTRGDGSRQSSPVDKGVMNDIEEGLRLLERSGTLGNDSTSARSAKEAVAALVKHVLAARGKSSPFSDMNGDSMGTAVSLTANAAIEELQRLRRENSNLEQRIRSLEATGSVSSSSGSPAAERALQTRCDVLVREREAVQTIMEQKIKVLVQSVAHAVGAVLQTSPQAGGSAGHALSKDVAALQRLVNASIAALRNAAASSGSASGPASSPSSSIQSASGSPARQSRQPPPPPLAGAPNSIQSGSGSSSGSASGSSHGHHRQHGHHHGHGHPHRSHHGNQSPTSTSDHNPNTGNDSPNVYNPSTAWNK